MNRHERTPRRTPAIAMWILRLLLPADDRDPVLGDLEEEFQALREDHGPVRRHLLIWRRTLSGARLAVQMRSLARASRSDRTAVSRRSAGTTRRRFGMRNDWTVALRRMSRRMSTYGAGILILTVGIGGATSIFSIFDSVLFPKLAIPEPEHLYTIQSVSETGSAPVWFSYRELQQLTSEPIPDARAAITRSVSASISAGDRVRRAWGEVAMSGFDEALGVRPILGSSLPTGPEASERGVLLSARLWNEAFDSDPGAIGSTVEIDRTPFRLIGILPEGFGGVGVNRTADFWVAPAAWYGPDFDAEDAPYITPLLVHVERPDRLGAVEGTLDRRLRALRAVETDDPPLRYTLAPSSHLLLGSERGGVGGVWGILTLLSIMVLVVACFNVAILLLAEGARRGSEFGLRRALGASRRRISSLVLIETVLLVGVSAIFGMALSYVLVQFIPGWLPPSDPPIVFPIRTSASAVGVAIGLTVVSTLAAGLIPAVRAGREKHGLGAGSSRVTRSGRLSEVLVVAQVTVAVALLIVTALLSRSIDQIRGQNLGYEEEGHWAFYMNAATEGYEGDRAEALVTQVTERIGAEMDVAITSAAPFLTWPTFPVWRDESGLDTLRVRTVSIGPEYFETMGGSLLNGRGFRAGSEDPDAIIVSRVLAMKVWEEEEVVGRTLWAGPDRQPSRVVGVARDGSYGLDGPLDIVFTPMTPDKLGYVTFVVASDRSASVVRQAVAGAVADIDRSIPPPRVFPLSEWFERAWLLNRAVTSLSRVLGLFALIICTIGVYARVLGRVEERRRETGIRVALGATPSRVAGNVLGRTIALVGIGLTLGAIIAAYAGRFVESFLVNVGPGDPLSFAVIAVVILSAGALAAWGPSRKVVRTNPVEVMRAE